MDNNNWRPTQSGGEPAMDAGGDWRSQLQADSRQRIVTKMYVYQLLTKLLCMVVWIHVYTYNVYVTQKEI